MSKPLSSLLEPTEHFIRPQGHVVIHVELAIAGPATLAAGVMQALQHP